MGVEGVEGRGHMGEPMVSDQRCDELEVVF